MVKAYDEGAAFERQNELAIRAAREADRIEPRAAAVMYDPKQALVMVKLRSGYAFGFPPERLPRLVKASKPQLENVRLSPSGDGLHWDYVDVHASLTGLIADALNLREWAAHHGTDPGARQRPRRRGRTASKVADLADPSRRRRKGNEPPVRSSDGRSARAEPAARGSTRRRSTVA